MKKDQVSPENVYKIQKSFLKRIEKDLRKDIKYHEGTMDGMLLVGGMFWTLELLKIWQEIIKDDFKNGNL